MDERASSLEIADHGAERHRRCWVCGVENDHGLHVDFRPDDDGGVRATFPCPERYAGYDGRLHGGVISSLLDGAMTRCLMAHGEVAVTADLRVRFRRAVRIGRPAELHARVRDSRRGVHRVVAELSQDGQVCAHALGRFLAHPDDGARPPDRAP